MDYDCSMSLNVISWNATNQVVIFRYEREIQFLLFTRFSENPLEKQTKHESQNRSNGKFQGATGILKR